MLRIPAFVLLLLISACKAKPPSQLRLDEQEPSLIQIEERGGFRGSIGPYTFSTAGTLFYKGNSLRVLKNSETALVKQQASLIKGLRPYYESSGQPIERSLKLFSPTDTLIFNWGLEEEKAAQYNKIYRRLSQLVNE